MTHSDPDLLKAMKFEIGRCENCGATGCILDFHHLWKRGLGGGSRLDCRIFGVILCRTSWGLGGCHARCELTGKDRLTRTDLLRIVARREHTTPRAIECVHGWLDRLDKDASEERVELSMKLLSPGAVGLARRTWEQIQKSKTKRRSA